MNLRRLLSVAFSFALVTTVAQAQNIVSPNGSLSFSPGDLLIYQTGNGSAALSNAATPIFLDDYNPNGTLIQSIALPTSGGNLMTAEGTAINEGQMAVSPNGQFVAFTGYSEAVGGSKPSNTAPTATQRVAATLSYNGTLNVVPMGTTAFNANNVRSAFTTDGINIWAAGAGGSSGGVWFTNGTGNQTQLTSSALRYVTGVNGQLVANNGTALLSVGTGLPTSGTQTSANIITGLTGNSAAFFAVDLSNTIAGLDTIYVTSTNSTTNSLQKYTLTSGNFLAGTWVQTGNIALGTLGNGNGTLGLVGVADGSNVTVYGTSSSTFFGFTDTSGYDGTLAASVTTLATVSANTAFRGLTFVPEQITSVPEPSQTALLVGLSSLATVGILRRRAKKIAAA